MRKNVGRVRVLATSVLALALIASPGVGWASPTTPHSTPVSTPSTPSTNGGQMLAGSVNPLVASGKATYVSKMAPDKQVTLAFLLKPRQMSKLEQLVTTGHKVTPQDYESQFAPTPDVQQTVQSFITQSGLKVVSSQSDLILVKGTVDQVQKALHVTLNNYVANKKQFFSTMNNPTVPTNVAANIVSIVGLNDVTYTAGPVKAHADPTSRNVLPQFVTPDAVRTAYGLIPAYTNGIDGSGEQIAVLMTGGFDNADVQAFSDQFGIPYNDSNIQAVKVPGTPDPWSYEPESTLDVEWSHAMAPGATVTEYETGDLFTSDLLAGFDRALQDHPTVINMSFGGPELFMADADLAAWHTLFLKAVAQGTTPVASSGDQGAFFPGVPIQTVQHPASDPLVLSVGGTGMTFQADNTRDKEYVWNDASWSGGPDEAWIPGMTIGTGGGISTVFTDPLASQTKLNAGTMRQVPDISMPADNLSMELAGELSLGWVGTSFSAPMWSGLLALAAQKAGHSFGDVRPAIYGLAQSDNSSTLFYDITSGSDSQTNTNGAFQAGPGFDLTTGWGSPKDGWGLIQALASTSANPGPDRSTPTIDGLVIGNASIVSNQEVFQGTGTLTLLGAGFGDAPGTVTLTAADGHAYDLSADVTSWSSTTLTVNTDEMFRADGHPTSPGTYTLSVSPNGTVTPATTTVKLSDNITTHDSGSVSVASKTGQTVTATINGPDGKPDTSYTGPGTLTVQGVQNGLTQYFHVSQNDKSIAPDAGEYSIGSYTITFTDGVAEFTTSSSVAGLFTYQVQTTDIDQGIPDTTAQFTAGDPSMLVAQVGAPSVNVASANYVDLRLYDENQNQPDASDVIEVTMSGSKGTAMMVDEQGNTYYPSQTLTFRMIHGAYQFLVFDEDAETLQFTIRDVTHPEIHVDPISVSFTQINNLTMSRPSGSPTPLTTDPANPHWQSFTVQSVYADQTVAPFDGNADLIIDGAPQGADVYVQQQKADGSWTNNLTLNEHSAYPIDLTTGTAKIRVAANYHGLSNYTAAGFSYEVMLEGVNISPTGGFGLFLNGPAATMQAYPVLNHMATSTPSTPQYDQVLIIPYDAEGNEAEYPRDASWNGDQLTVSEEAGGPAIKVAVMGQDGTLHPTQKNADGTWTFSMDTSGTNTQLYVTSAEPGVAKLNFKDDTNADIKIQSTTIAFVNSVPTSLRAITPQKAEKNTDQTVTVQVLDQNGQPVINDVDQIAMKITGTSGKVTVKDATGKVLTPQVGGVYNTTATAGVATFTVNDDTDETPHYTFKDVTQASVHQIVNYTFSTTPLAPFGTLSPGATVNETVTAVDPDGNPVPNAAVFLSASFATGGGTANVGEAVLSAEPQHFITDSNGQVTVTYHAPTTYQYRGKDVLTVQDVAENPLLVATDSYEFAELDPSKIVVINNLGSKDEVDVSGLVKGDIVKVYASSDSTHAIATSSVVSSNQTSAKIKLTLPSAQGGTLYVSVQSNNQKESGRIPVTYQAEPSPILQSKQIKIQNNLGDADQLTVTGLTSGDSIAVYDATTGGNQLAVGDATGDDKHGYAAMVSLKLPNVTGGKVYVAVRKAGLLESARTMATYAAEPYPALEPNQITVTNNTGHLDQVLVTGLNAYDTVSVYADASSTKPLGAAVAFIVSKTGVISATVTTALNSKGGSVYVTVKSNKRPESARTKVDYSPEHSVAPKKSAVQIVNTFGDSDFVVISGLQAGDVVNVYGADSKEELLGSASASAKNTSGTTNATVPVKLDPNGGTVYVTVTSKGLMESATTPVPYAAEPPAGPDLNQITVVNNSGPRDTLSVTGLHSGDTVKVYLNQTDRTAYATSVKVPANQSSLTLSLKLPTSTAGTIYVSVLDKNHVETSRTAVNYDAEPQTTLDTFTMTTSYVDLTFTSTGMTEIDPLQVDDPSAE